MTNTSDNCTRLEFKNPEIKNFTDICFSASYCSGIIFRDLIIHEYGYDFSVHLLGRSCV
jgi:hypothetical protein